MGNTSMTRLKQSDIEELARMTHYNEVEVVERHNEFIRKCPNGRMKLKQFKEIYTASFNSYAEDYAEHIFRSTDNDHNGYVDFREYLKCISITTRGNLDERLHFIFNVYDMDGNGTIDRHEMKQILSAFYSMKYNYRRWLKDETANVRTDRIFEKYDVNKDGFLSREEFIIAAKEDPYIILTDNAPNSQGSIKYKPVIRSEEIPPPQVPVFSSQDTRPLSRQEIRETPSPQPNQTRHLPSQGAREIPSQQFQPRSTHEMRTHPERRGNHTRQKPLQEIRNPVQVPYSQGYDTMEFNPQGLKRRGSQEHQPPVYDPRDYYYEQWDNNIPSMAENMPIIKQTTV